MDDAPCAPREPIERIADIEIAYYLLDGEPGIGRGDQRAETVAPLEQRKGAAGDVAAADDEQGFHRGNFTPHRDDASGHDPQHRSPVPGTRWLEHPAGRARRGAGSPLRLPRRRLRQL